MIWLFNGHRLQAGMHRVTMGCSAVRFLQIPFVVTPPRLPLLLSLALMPKSYESGQLLYQAGWKWAWCVGICWTKGHRKVPFNQSPLFFITAFFAYFLNLGLELVSKNNLWLILRQQLSVSRQGTQPSTCIWCSAEPLPLLLGQSGPARAHGPTYLGCWPLSGSTWEVWWMVLRLRRCGPTSSFRTEAAGQRE